MLGLFVPSPVIHKSAFTLPLLWNDEGWACPLTIAGINSTTLDASHPELLHGFCPLTLELIFPVTISFRVPVSAQSWPYQIFRDPEGSCWQLH